MNSGFQDQSLNGFVPCQLLKQSRAFLLGCTETGETQNTVSRIANSRVFAGRGGAFQRHENRLLLDGR